MMPQTMRRCAPMVYTKAQASVQAEILMEARKMPGTWKSYEVCKQRYLEEVGIFAWELYDRLVLRLLDVLGYERVGFAVQGLPKSVYRLSFELRAIPEVEAQDGLEGAFKAHGTGGCVPDTACGEARR